MPAAGRLSWTIHPLPVAYADPALMRMVLVNLQSNAVRSLGHASDRAHRGGIDTAARWQHADLREG